ncbi:hypothetical protein [Promicromonospora sp. NFX87]|uniref:hypothetical protein n=1 Tax=Promicromonospora sp. NFX87 TaxID=3402691 RepID=UPI003AFAA765
MTFLLTPPVRGLDDLSIESRVIATPWSRIVRGIGLGQHPIGWDATAASRIRDSFALLDERAPGVGTYTGFARALAELVLQVADPSVRLGYRQTQDLMNTAADSAFAIANPYYRLTAGCALLSAVAKLGVSKAHLLDGDRDIPAQVLATIGEIRPDGIKDENRGRHGDYEKLSAWTAVFLAFGQLDLHDRLVSAEHDHVAEALALIDNIPAPFFRGRGGSMLLSATMLLGFDGHIFDGPTNYVSATLSYLDRVDELQIYPSFPSPMSPAFAKVYPLLTMLNAVAVTGRLSYLESGRDRLAEAAELMAAVAPVERTHMGLYHVVALHNLQRLTADDPRITGIVEPLVAQWRDIDPGQDYFLYGISYAYLTQLAFFTGREDLITESMVDRMLTAFPSLERSAESRANRPYPFSYVLNVLTELGLGDLLYTPHDAYGGSTPFRWFADHLSPGGRAEQARLYMVDHALLSWALRLRPADAVEPGALGRFRFAAGEEW